MKKKRDESYKTIMVPCVSVNPNYICLYGEPADGRNYNSKRFIENKKNLANNSHSGVISAKASKRINQAISWFSALTQERKHTSNGLTIRHRLNFITLTLSDKQKHSDQFVKQRMLNWFLNELKKEFFVTSYLWRAEAQENGNIHFHIIINRFVHHKAIRHIWNKIQNNFGYLESYYKKFGTEKQPPSTEIKAVYKCRNISGYLSKYVSKDVSIIKFKSTASQAAVKELLKQVPGILSVYKKDQTNDFRIKFDPTRSGFGDIETAIESLNTTVERVKLRPIKGRLWFLSNTLKKMKNSSKQLVTNFASDLVTAVKRGVIKAKEIINEHSRVFVFDVVSFLHLPWFSEIKKMFYWTELQWQFSENKEILKYIINNRK